MIGKKGKVTMVTRTASKKTYLWVLHFQPREVLGGFVWTFGPPFHSQVAGRIGGESTKLGARREGQIRPAILAKTPCNKTDISVSRLHFLL